MISYRHDIDGLRCLAVLLVVLFHIQLPALSGGYIGVDVFFVISGYLVTSVITGAMAKGKFRFADFYARRIRRLFPAVFVTVIGSLVAGWFLFPPDAFSDLAQSSIATLLSGSNIYFWATSGYFETAAHYKPLLHTWSLSIEEQFYLVWPLSIALIAGAAVKRNRLIVALVAAVLISTGLAEWAIRTDRMTAAFFMLPFRINEFAIGALVAFLPAWKNRMGNNGLALIGLAGMIAPGVLFTPETVFPGINAMLPCVATALLIYAGRETLTARALSNPVLTYVGRMSYSFYLAHWPIIAFYLFWRGSATGLEPLEQAGLLAASFALGALMYHLVEVPFRLSKGTARIAPTLDNNGVGLWFTGSTLAAVLFAALVWGRQGIPERYDNNPEIAKLLASMEPIVGDELRQAVASMTGPREILLMGDSHAGVAVASYAKWAAKNRTRVDRTIRNGSDTQLRLIAGCAPLINTLTPVNEEWLADCYRKNFEELPNVDVSSYDAVVLTARWGLYTNKSTERGRRFGKLNTPIRLSLEEERYTDIQLARERFRTALRATVKTFNDQGVPVIFVGQVPHVGESPKACVVRARSVREVEQKCNLASYAQTQAETAWATAFARKVDGLIVYDPTPLFCPNRQCLLVKDGMMLYRDADHLSPTGADFLLEGLGPVLNQAMTR